MALIPFTVTVIDHVNNPNNTLANTDIEIRTTQSGEPLAQIYSDDAGLNPIPQPGAQTNNLGVFYFYAESGGDFDYKAISSGFSENISGNSHNKLSNLNAVGGHDAIYPRRTTVAEIESGVFTVIPSLFEVSDAGFGKFKLVSGGTPDGVKVLDAGNGNTAIMEDEYPLLSTKYQLVGDASDEAVKLQLFASDCANVDAVIQKPASFYKSSQQISFPENTGLKCEKQLLILPTSGFVDGTFLINLGKDSTVDNLYLSDVIDKRFTIHGLRVVDGLPVAQAATINRFIATRFNIALYVRGHNNNINGPSLFDNIYGLYVGSTPSETEPGGPSGSANIIGGRINDNHYGLYQSIEGIDSYSHGVIFEYNRRHVYSEGNTRIANCYMTDAASICFDGGGTLDLVNTNMTCLGMGTPRLDGLSDVWDNSNAGTDWATAINIKKAKLANCQFFTAQRNISPRDRTSLFGSTTVTLNSCDMQMLNEFSGVGQFCIAKSTFSVLPTVITPESTTKQNYISNGLFQDASALDATYIGGTFTVDVTRGNPWGGRCLNVFRGGIQLKYSVPNFEANKKYLLMVFKGSILSGTGQATGVDMTNSTISNYTPPQVTTNKTTTGNAVCVSGVTHSDRETLGVTSFIVTLDSADGQINLTNTLTVTTGKEQVYGVVLCDIDSNDIDSLTHIPIGYYTSGGLISI